MLRTGDNLEAATGLISVGASIAVRIISFA